MAMVSKLKLVPDSHSLRIISCDEPALLYKEGAQANVSWYLSTPLGRSFLVLVDYQNVVFKFECFGMILDEKKINLEHSIIKESPIIEMYSVEFLFRSEWERQAKPSEVQSHYEQVQRSYGAFSNIEDSATAACISLVGITWISDRKKPTKQALLIDPDGDNPTALVHCQDQKEIAAFLASCDVVLPKDLGKWEEKIDFWLKQ